MGPMMPLFPTEHFFIDSSDSRPSKNKEKHMKQDNIDRQTCRKNKGSSGRLHRIMVRVFTKSCTFKSKSVINNFSDNKINSTTRIQ